MLLPLGLERGVKQISSERLANRTIRGSKSQQMKTDAPLLMFLASVLIDKCFCFQGRTSSEKVLWICAKQGLSVGASTSVSAEVTAAHNLVCDSTSLLHGTKKSSLVNVD